MAGNTDKLFLLFFQPLTGRYIVHHAHHARGFTLLVMRHDAAKSAHPPHLTIVCSYYPKLGLVDAGFSNSLLQRIYYNRSIILVQELEEMGYVFFFPIRLEAK